MKATVERRQHERAETLLRERVGSLWPPGSRLPPIRELAQRLGLGHNSTQRAVNKLVQDGLLASSPRRGTMVRGPHNSLDTPGSSTSNADTWPLLGKRVTVCRALLDPFVLEVDAPVRATLEKLGVTVEFVSLAEGDATKAMQEACVGRDAVILINQNPAAVPESCAAVLIAPGWEHVVPPTRPVDVVTVDAWQGGYLAGAHMCAIGCDGICFLGVWENRTGVHSPTSAARLAGFEAGYGAPIPPAHYLRSSMYQTSVGANRVRDWLALNPRPQGVFAASDDLAIGFVHGALAHGLEPGVDYHIIGFDGQQRGQTLAGHRLTSVRVPMAEMGRHAAMLIADRLLHPAQPSRRLTLSVELGVGDTAVRLDPRTPLRRTQL